MSRAIPGKGYSQRRACALGGLAPKTCRHASTRPDDAALREPLRRLAHKRRRFGDRRLHYLPRRKGIDLTHGKLFRLHAQERPGLRRRGGRTRAIGPRAPMAIPQGPNRRWSVDVVPDVLIGGRRVRIFAVVEDFTRECLALIVDTSISGARMVREPEKTAGLRGRPCMIVSDNGAELASNAVLARSEETGIAWPCIAPGKPMRDTPSPSRSTAGSATNVSTSPCSEGFATPAG